MPSPSRSPITIPHGPDPVVKSTLPASEPVVIIPGVLVFRNTETELAPELTTDRSGLPSPSISPKAIRAGEDPVVKSTLVEKEPVVMEPDAPVLRKIETVLLL